MHALYSDCFDPVDTTTSAAVTRDPPAMLRDIFRQQLQTGVIKPEDAERALAKAVEVRDEYTGSHVERVCHYTMKIAEQVEQIFRRLDRVSVERQQQIGVTYAKVERKPLAHTIRSVGLIVPDRSRNWQFVSRVDGYVQKLNVTSPGQVVDKDAPLLSIYSPDLLTSEREFVALLRMRDQAKTKDARETPQRLIESAKRRLQLWNMMPEQVAELEKTRKASDTLTLLSP